MNQDEGIDEELVAVVRSAINTASQAGMMMSRHREQQARRAKERSEREQKELQARYDTEWAIAQDYLRNADRDQWWQEATPDELGHMWQTTTAWAAHQREAAERAETFADRMQREHGVDPRDYLHEPGHADSAGVADAVAAQRAADHERATARREIDEANNLVTNDLLSEQAEYRQNDLANEAAGVDDRGERARAVSEAEQRDARGDAYNSDARNTYDSAARREAEANRLADAGVPEDALAAKMSSDTAQGRPARDATKDGAKRSSRSRRNRSGQERGRSGVGR